MDVGGVGKDDVEFFSTSHLIAAAVKFRPYQEGVESGDERVEL